jgi:hypothetical protein
MAGFLLATRYATMAAAGLIVDLLFQGAGLVPRQRHAKVETAAVHDRAEHRVPRSRAVLVVRCFRRGGGVTMLRMMNRPTAAPLRLRA